MSDAAPLEVRVPVALRWRDMDMLGHLNQAVYHEMLEEGRGALLMKLAENGAPVNHTYVLVRVELDYRTEVRKDHGSVEVHVRVEQVGRSSIALTHDVLHQDGTVAATGRSVLVGWDAAARGKREISAEERVVLGV